MSKTFKDLEREAPDFPDHTCPTIDAAIKACEDASNYAQSIVDELDKYIGWKSGFEELRDQNEELRGSGIYWREQCKKLCDEVEDLECRLEEAQRERDQARAMLAPIFVLTPEAEERLRK